MTKTINIHETAFMTSMFRSMNQDLSKDRYSKLWNNAKTKVWVDDYLEHVSKEEINTHCLRNRFFLETIDKVFREDKIDVLINFGSGFSMYPFLLREQLLHIEIDKPEIVNYKEDKINAWMNSGVLPERNIHFIGVDFSQSYSQKLIDQIKTIVKNKSVFILIEGVLFFLKKHEAKTLFEVFEKIEKKGDLIGSVSFQHGIKNTPVFKRLVAFFNARLTKTSKEDYLTLDTRFYNEKTTYKILDIQDYFSYSKKINNTVILEHQEILNEHFYVLQKTQ